MNLEAALKVVDEKWGECKRGPIGEVLRALCSEPTPIKIEDLRIGMRVRTRQGIVDKILSLYGRDNRCLLERGDTPLVSDIVEILP